MKNAMNESKTILQLDRRGLFMVVVLFLLAGSRFVQLPYNLNAVGASFLFWGFLSTQNDGKWAWIPFLVLLGTDVFFGFYSALPFVYLGFLVVMGAGVYLRKKDFFRIGEGAQSLKGAVPLLLASSIGSVGFYLLSNFGVWMTSSSYPKSFAGLLMCYEAAIPFFRNTLSGNLCFSAVYLLLLSPSFWSRGAEKLGMAHSKQHN